MQAVHHYAETRAQCHRFVAQPEPGDARGDALIERDLLYRDDHTMILECIRANTNDPAAAERNVVRAAVGASHRRHARALAAGCRIICRDDATRPEEMLSAIEAHFGLER